MMKSQKGITLIALVITIIVLLILAGISIAMLTGDNGLLTKSKDAEIKTNHAEVLEAMQIEAQSYYLEKQTENLQDDMITYFVKAEILEENTNIINTERLLGHSLSTGNGTIETGDVYALEEAPVDTAKLATTAEIKVAETEEGTKTYIVKYYGKNNEEELPLGNLNDKMETEVKDYSYLFEIDGEGTISLAGNSIYAYENLKEKDGTDITDLIIPNKVKGQVVTGIADSAFDKCESLRTVKIPDTVTYIGSKAFNLCSELTTVNLPSNLKSIESEAFCLCRKLTNIDFPEGLEYIGSEAFFAANSLTKILIPSSLNSDLNGVFLGCGLESIEVDSKNQRYYSKDGVLFDRENNSILLYPFQKVGSQYSIPNGITRIEEKAFEECDELTNIEIPDSVTSIESEAFSGCDGLVNIKIPDGVTSIGARAFAYCSGLIKIILPSGITNIPDGAFMGCLSLQSALIPSNVTKIGGQAFADCNELTTINYRGSKEQWNAINITQYGNFGWIGKVPINYNYDGE